MAGKPGRRGHGEDTIFWEESRACWAAEVSLGQTASGRRKRRRVRGRTKTEVRERLRELRAEVKGGVKSAARFTVADAVQAWLTSGLQGRDPLTVKTNQILAETHVIPDLGAVRLRDLTADDVDEWLNFKAQKLATRTLQAVLAVLRRSIRHAQRRDLVMRNVAELVDLLKGQGGRPSKALTVKQADAVLVAARGSTLHAYFVLSLLTGIRTEEARALTWERVHLDVTEDRPPNVEVWRSVRASGDTKTRKSRRTLKLPPQAVEALRVHRVRQAEARANAGVGWQENDLVFCTQIGTPLDAANVRRSFRAIVKAAGIEGSWTPRELRHSFVSLLSAHDIPIKSIARLLGHSGTAVTEQIYRKELRPMLLDGAEAIESIFDREDGPFGYQFGYQNDSEGAP